MTIEGYGMNVQQFAATEHPYMLPGHLPFMDAINWSLPVIMDLVITILDSLLLENFESTSMLGGRTIDPAETDDIITNS